MELRAPQVQGVLPERLCNEAERPLHKSLAEKEAHRFGGTLEKQQAILLCTCACSRRQNCCGGRCRRTTPSVELRQPLRGPTLWRRIPSFERVGLLWFNVPGVCLLQPKTRPLMAFKTAASPQGYCLVHCRLNAAEVADNNVEEDRVG